MYARLHLGERGVWIGEREPGPGLHGPEHQDREHLSCIFSELCCANYEAGAWRLLFESSDWREFGFFFDGGGFSEVP